MSRIDTLRKSWTAMFTHIDEIVTKVVEEYPKAEPLVDRNIIEEAVRQTTGLEEFIRKIETLVEEQKDKNQKELFDK